MENTIKHQLYRCRDKEVVLVNETKHETKDDGRPGKILAWQVRPVTLSAGGEALLGEAFEADTAELSWVGRTVTTHASA